MTKRRLLAILLLIMVVGITAFPALAQEPTEPAPDPSDDNVTVIQAPEDGGVVVVQSPPAATVEAEENTTQDYITTILAAAGFAAAAMAYLNSRDRNRILQVGERAEGIGWTAMTTFSEALSVLGGQPDVSTSSDPAVIARALRDKNMHVFIRKEVDVKAVFQAYQNQGGTP